MPMMFFFLVVGGIADVGGDVARGGEVSGFDQAQQVGGEVAEVFLFEAVGGFAGGVFAVMVCAAFFKQGGAQAAFEGAAGDERRAGVRVGGGASMLRRLYTASVWFHAVRAWTTWPRLFGIRWRWRR